MRLLKNGIYVSRKMTLVIHSVNIYLNYDRQAFNKPFWTLNKLIKIIWESKTDNIVFYGAKKSADEGYLL
jgi:glutamine amidotransferase-like uncharacterized protein